MKKTISLLLYIVALISTIFGADLKGPSLLFYIIATVILGYYFIKTGIEIVCGYKKRKTNNKKLQRKRK